MGPFVGVVSKKRGWDDGINKSLFTIIYNNYSIIIPLFNHYQTIITIIITGYNHYQPLLTTINSWLPSHSNPCDGNGNGSGNLWIVGCGSVIVQVAEN